MGNVSIVSVPHKKIHDRHGLKELCEERQGSVLGECIGVWLKMRSAGASDICHPKNIVGGEIQCCAHSGLNAAITRFLKSNKSKALPHIQSEI